MPDLITPEATIQNLGVINVIVGRNGSGKSRFLRGLILHFQNSEVHFTKYVSPERGGSFLNEANIDQNTTNQDWFRNTRNRNQSGDFKKTSASLLRQLENAWGRRLDSDQALRVDTSKTFQTEYLNKINNLLLNIRIVNNSNEYTFSFETYAGEKLNSENISSGESEAVSLSTEVLHFFSNIDVNKTNILALDEPDVHLHPDLQVRLAKFLIDQVDELPAEKREKVIVVIATHSAPLACALAISDHTKIGTKHFGSNIVVPRLSPEHFRQTATFFAHPLSQVIADEPLFIIEGDDDSRVFQQAARSSNGRVRIFPCVAESVDQMTALERFTDDVLRALYDDPIAYSLRDGDGARGPLEPIGCVIRFRLQCYAIENLLLTDEFLQKMNFSWDDFQIKATLWSASRRADDGQANLLSAAIQAPDRYRDTKIKDIRTIICSVMESDKPWEFLLGQVIANLPNPLPQEYSDTSIISFIGMPALLAMGFNAPEV